MIWRHLRNTRCATVRGSVTTSSSNIVLKTLMAFGGRYHIVAGGVLVLP